MRNKRACYTNAAVLARVPGGGDAWHRAAMVKADKPAGPAPTRAALHDAAVRHLARFAATEAGLVRVLERKVRRWARQAEAERGAAETEEALAAVRSVARAMVETGLVDDAGFAAMRARRLAQGGRSRRATSAYLAGKGVAAAVAGAALPPAESELPTSLVYARKRRIGPFRDECTEATRLRDLGALARAGFPRDVAERALAMTPDEATALVLAFKRD